MQPEQVLAVEELSDFLLAERVDSDVYFREPGGMGLPPLETIAIFTGTSIAGGGGILDGLAKAVLKAAVAWGRERIRRQPLVKISGAAHHAYSPGAVGSVAKSPSKWVAELKSVIVPAGPGEFGVVIRYVLSLERCGTLADGRIGADGD